MFGKLFVRTVFASTFLAFMSLSIYAENNLDQDRITLLKHHQSILSAFEKGDADFLFANVSDRSFRFSSVSGELEWTEKEEGIRQRRKYFQDNVFSKCEDIEPPYIKINEARDHAWVLAKVQMVGETKTSGNTQAHPFSSNASWMEIYQKTQDKWIYVGGVIEGMREEAKK